MVNYLLSILRMQLFYKVSTKEAFKGLFLFFVKVLKQNQYNVYENNSYWFMFVIIKR